MRRVTQDPERALPEDLTSAITRAGYYPALVCDVVESALAGEEVVSHLVHQETTFDHETVRRHVTVLAVTSRRLVIAHADDHAEPGAQATATATTETVPLDAVRGVMVTHVVTEPEGFVQSSPSRDITLTLGWGAVSRLDLLPAQCGDPECTADHGFEGTVASDDISLRISAAADGEAAVERALSFARHLSRAIGGSVRA
ncbi:MAG TPA: DUF5998 family protein [Intrasporangium sp.]|nr:DUF5998 family protein [Intrasporangium sp.]HEX5966972.1 DUF5998 family protein [Intrasporangium sp.]